MEHVLYDTGDEGVPEAILDSNGEVVLAVCKVCNGAEGTLPTDCPGEWLSESLADAIYAGNLDYIGGAWKTLNRKER